MTFRCPICHADEYQRVVVPRPPRDPYETEFFCCLGCSAVFLEPELFTAAPTLRQENDQAAAEPGDRGPEGANADRLRRDRVRYRFWHAKAKREDGLGATPEAVLRVRGRYRQ